MLINRNQHQQQPQQKQTIEFNSHRTHDNGNTSGRLGAINSTFNNASQFQKQISIKAESRDGNCFPIDHNNITQNNSNQNNNNNINNDTTEQHHQQQQHSSPKLNYETHNNGNPSGKISRKRTMANERERERTKMLNRALALLRNKLPCKESEKRSKIQTLRMAKEYIEYLATTTASATLTTTPNIITTQIPPATSSTTNLTANDGFQYMRNDGNNHGNNSTAHSNHLAYDVH